MEVNKTEYRGREMDFDQIYDEYFDRIYYKILSSVKNAEDAEDAD